MPRSGAFRDGLSKITRVSISREGNGDAGLATGHRPLPPKECPPPPRQGSAATGLTCDFPNSPRQSHGKREGECQVPHTYRCGTRRERDTGQPLARHIQPGAVGAAVNPKASA